MLTVDLSYGDVANTVPFPHVASCRDGPRLARGSLTARRLEILCLLQHAAERKTRYPAAALICDPIFSPAPSTAWAALVPGRQTA
jgi:hypothetical protein